MTHQMPVYDARRNHATLDQEGFQRVDHPYEHVNYYNEEEVFQRYYKEVQQLVQKTINANSVYVFDHILRAFRKEGQDQPVAVVHNDYTLDGASRRLQLFTEPPLSTDTWAKTHNGKPLISKEEFEKLKGKRYVIINVWRNISNELLTDYPLAFVDAKTLSKDDLITNELRYSDRIGEVYLSRYNSNHHWYYYPNLNRNETILLKTWDSHGLFLKDTEYESQLQGIQPISATFCLHSAFIDPLTLINAPKRESIEVRTIAFFD